MPVAIIKQKDLLTQRWRNVEAIDPSELNLQIRLVSYLRQHCRPDVVWWHTPNGEYRDRRTAAKLKAMGVLPGVADLVFVGRGQILFLELKRRGERPTLAQHSFARSAEWAGAHYEWTDSFGNAVDILQQRGLLTDPACQTRANQS